VASRTEEYRRLARECLESARTFPIGERRTTLLQMAQVWQRLADEQNHAPDLTKCPRHRLPVSKFDLSLLKIQFGAIEDRRFLTMTALEGSR
jgi:hypothetical protein